MEEFATNDIVLEDGSNIAVVGGGPAGSFFSYFALDFADRFGLDINIDIIEAKNFNSFGPQGCNNCGGIISESLIQTLSTEGIVIPSSVIRRGIETYTLHFEQGDSVIETPLKEQRIASVYRGLGPRGMSDSSVRSFDNYLLELCETKGANIIDGKLTEAQREDNGIILKTNKSFEKKYDFVVGAVGLSKKTAYANRVVLIGDSSSSKLYKNGIGAAYITAKAAAKTAIFNGISENDFKKQYQAVCNELNTDNLIGKFIFLVTTVIQKSGLLKRGVLNMVISEQKKESHKRKMSSVLWDTFTGSATYKSIFFRVVNPIVLINLIWNIIYGIFKTKKK